MAGGQPIRASLGKQMTLHPGALTPEQRSILAASAALSKKWEAYLAGGAALALQLGHRRSVDFDWFTKATLQPSSLEKDLSSLGLPIEIDQNYEGTFLGTVGSVHYSVFRYRYPLVGRPVTFEGCALAPLEDIAAMKMTAIVQRAVKRDYVDLHAILVEAKVPLTRVLATMERKFPGLDSAPALRALGYFKDVEKQAMPDMIARTSWDQVKRGLGALLERSVDIDLGR
jgi:hypothetical protein